MADAVLWRSGIRGIIKFTTFCRDFHAGTWMEKTADEEALGEEFSASFVVL